MPPESQQPPYRAYATIFGMFVTGLGVVSGLAAARRRPLQEFTPIDLTMLGLATFKASRTVTRDRVTSFVRDPFVEGKAYDGKGERPVQDTEMKRAIGELVTCTRCIGTWIAAALASTEILAPRTGRLLTSVLAAGALNDFLLAGFKAFTSKAIELEEPSSAFAPQRGGRHPGKLATRAQIPTVPSSFVTSIPGRCAASPCSSSP